MTNCGWWGEGEIKFFLDGDGEYPTICGTGTEDYFGGAWGFFKHPQKDQVEQAFNAPFYGMPLAHTGSVYTRGIAGTADRPVGVIDEALIFRALERKIP